MPNAKTAFLKLFLSSAPPINYLNTKNNQIFYCLISGARRELLSDPSGKLKAFYRSYLKKIIFIILAVIRRSMQRVEGPSLDLSPRLDAWATQLRRNIATVLAALCTIRSFGNQTPDPPHRSVLASSSNKSSRVNGAGKFVGCQLCVRQRTGSGYACPFYAGHGPKLLIQEHEH